MCTRLPTKHSRSLLIVRNCFFLFACCKELNFLSNTSTVCGHVSMKALLRTHHCRSSRVNVPSTFMSHTWHEKIFPSTKRGSMWVFLVPSRVCVRETIAFHSRRLLFLRNNRFSLKIHSSNIFHFKNTVAREPEWRRERWKNPFSLENKFLSLD